MAPRTPAPAGVRASLEAEVLLYDALSEIVLEMERTCLGEVRLDIDR